MKKTWKLAVAAAVLVTLPNASAFAEPRHRNETNGGWRSDARNDSRRSMTMEGRVRSFSRERDGYRVQLDRGNYSYFVPQSAFRSRNGRRNDLKVGISLRFTGYLGSGNSFYVDDWDVVDDGYYNDGYGNNNGNNTVNGIVERVDYSRGTLLLRDDRSGRRVTVVMAGGSRQRRGIDLNDLSRGDRVTFTGDWSRNGVFEAYRIESLRDRR
jgi:hypothetical protein